MFSNSVSIFDWNSWFKEAVVLLRPPVRVLSWWRRTLSALKTGDKHDD